MVVYHKAGRQLRPLEPALARLRYPVHPRPFQIARKAGSGEIRFVPLPVRALRVQQILRPPQRGGMLGATGGNQGNQRPCRLRRRARPNSMLLRVNIRSAGFAPPAVRVLVRRQPFYRPLHKGLRHILSNRLQSRQRGAQPVYVIDAPPPEPAAVGLLFRAQVAIGRLQTAMVGPIPQLPVHLQNVRRNIRAGRIQHFPEVAERQRRKVIMVVVLVKRRPAAVLVLHPRNPGNRAPDGRLSPPVLIPRQPGKAQGQRNFSSVVHIGIPVIVELKSPAAGRQPVGLHLPVAPG